mmetsp:Transcript_27899/g.60563  ORF Transcript_27899/g.60563 Transcript_27899/m.60563 type:complete len:164 (+) Transcript_27899:253-744(+)|eukprot:CAMPEP_0206537194 /NCGR_PEP_ID=MMETSP0325_2-20121206/7184_1 /ASSEMBLY_ACC=CAM_ASM_000347 /TAXON_ID=2866 /ORGANISM="Crypthecodinium cohnii, Strain Seligo" /LENGTH=163 /DNA_ID=CAMNT_0054034519 /DNA_START=163 /DNA_END=654 /DNA_ORIENTATION=-
MMQWMYEWMSEVAVCMPCTGRGSREDQEQGEKPSFMYGDQSSQHLAELTKAMDVPVPAKPEPETEVEPTEVHMKSPLVELHSALERASKSREASVTNGSPGASPHHSGDIASSPSTTTDAIAPPIFEGGDDSEMDVASSVSMNVQFSGLRLLNPYHSVLSRHQ